MTEDETRVESAVNRYVAGKQQLLHLGPDAYFRSRGEDAITAAPPVRQRLASLRAALLEGADGDRQQRLLGAQLDAQLAYDRERIDRHIDRQSQAWQLQTALDRQKLIAAQAALDWNDDGSIDGLAEANASTARELARLSGGAASDIDPSTGDAARSAVYDTAIRQRLANGQLRQALALHERVGEGLTGEVRRTLAPALQAAATDLAADEALARNAADDPSLPPAVRLAAVARQQRRAAELEAGRLAGIRTSDDRLVASLQAMASGRAGDVPPGTLGALAANYDSAGDSGRARDAASLAAVEGVLREFAAAPRAAQDALLARLPSDGDFPAVGLAALHDIRSLQDTAFVRDPFQAGLAKYGLSVQPVDWQGDVAGQLAVRVPMARHIEAAEGVAVPPLTQDEVDGLRNRLARGAPAGRSDGLGAISALPADQRASLATALALSGDDKPPDDTGASGASGGKSSPEPDGAAPPPGPPSLLGLNGQSLGGFILGTLGNVLGSETRIPEAGYLGAAIGATVGGAAGHAGDRTMEIMTPDAPLGVNPVAP